MSKTVTALQGDTVDLICYRYYGKTQGVTEAVLSANRGLADQGPMLPEGLQILLPDYDTTQPAAAEMVQLWD